MQSVTGGAGLVAEMRPTAGRDDPFHHPSHALFRRIHLADETYLAPTPTVSDGYGVPRLRDIDPDKNFATMLHGSSSCGEDRLGHSEQPSKAQCRASHLGSADIRSHDAASSDLGVHHYSRAHAPIEANGKGGLWRNSAIATVDDWRESAQLLLAVVLAVLFTAITVVLLLR
jgi:hypothetical protein